MDNHSRFSLCDDVWLDVQRALWIESQRLLAVADLHLGYAWAHRVRGQLLPLAPDNTAQRLLTLCQRYEPRRFVLAGDIIHGELAQPEVLAIVKDVFNLLVKTGAEIIVLGGNHDGDLADVIARDEWLIQVRDHFSCGDYLFLHGDSTPPENKARMTIIGHEHPAIRLGDGITGSMKYPCFLASDSLIVLPAFSDWTSGTTITEGRLMSELARNAGFTKAIAVMGDRLLPINLA